MVTRQGLRSASLFTLLTRVKRFENVNGVNVHRVRVGKRNKSTASAHSMLLYPVSGLLKTIQLCREKNYDLINTHFAIPSGPLGVFMSKFFGIKHILSIHGADIHDPTRISPYEKRYYKRAIEFAVNNADIVVAQSNNTRDNVKSFYNIDNRIKLFLYHMNPMNLNIPLEKNLD